MWGGIFLPLKLEITPRINLFFFFHLLAGPQGANAGQGGCFIKKIKNKHIKENVFAHIFWREMVQTDNFQLRMCGPSPTCWRTLLKRTIEVCIQTEVNFKHSYSRLTHWFTRPIFSFLSKNSQIFIKYFFPYSRTVLVTTQRFPFTIPWKKYQNAYNQQNTLIYTKKNIFWGG